MIARLRRGNSPKASANPITTASCGGYATVSQALPQITGRIFRCSALNDLLHAPNLSLCGFREDLRGCIHQGGCYDGPQRDTWPLPRGVPVEKDLDNSLAIVRRRSVSARPLSASPHVHAHPTRGTQQQPDDDHRRFGDSNARGRRERNVADHRR
jgi:hypothetical protein